MLGAIKVRILAAAVLFASALTVFPTAGHALSGSNYCSAGSDGTVTQDTVPGSLLSVGDVRLWTGAVHTASDCYGDFDPGNSSPTNETAALNEIFGNIGGPGQFVYLDKTGAASNSNGLGGIQFSVQTYGGSDGTPGLWTIVWDSGQTAFNGPLKVDLAVLLVGGNHSAAYFLSGVVLPFEAGVGIGTFDIQFFNGSATLTGKCFSDYDKSQDKHSWSYDGKDKKKHKKKNSWSYDGKDKKNKHKNKHKDHCDKPEQPTISHLLLAGRIVPTVTQVPEPSSMALFGVGLAGLWVYRRRLSRGA